MFRALLAHIQDSLHKRHLVYCVRVMSVGCIRTEVSILVQPTDITLTDRRTHMTKLIVAFRNLANAPKKKKQASAVALNNIPNIQRDKQISTLNSSSDLQFS
jgi:hypothetical protein